MDSNRLGYPVGGGDTCMAADPYVWNEAQLNRFYLASIGKLLFDISGIDENAGLAMLKAMGYPVTSAHLNVVPHIDIEGTRLTTLAERAHLTKQSAWEALKTMQAHGYIARTKDPADSARRSHFVDAQGHRFSSRRLPRPHDQAGRPRQADRQAAGRDFAAAARKAARILCPAAAGSAPVRRRPQIAAEKAAHRANRQSGMRSGFHAEICARKGRREILALHDRCRQISAFHMR